MGKKRIYTVSEVAAHTKLFRTAVPFDVTHNGRVIATVMRPGGVWRQCEVCGENTMNIQEFKDGNGRWEKLILCDRCSDEYL